MNAEQTMSHDEIRDLVYKSTLRIFTSSGSHFYFASTGDAKYDVGKFSDGINMKMREAKLHVQLSDNTLDYDPKQIRIEDIEDGMRLSIRSGGQFWMTTVITGMEFREALPL